MKRPTQENSYKKQLTGVGVIVALAVLALGAFAVTKIVASQARPSAQARGADPASQLARDMERAFPLISILGVDEDSEGNRITVLLFDPEPEDIWGEAEFEKMDSAILLAMEFADGLGRNLTINFLNDKASVVTPQGEEVVALVVGSSMLCWLTEMEDDVNWARADHDTVVENCTMFPVGGFWAKAEMILWPLEQLR